MLTHGSHAPGSCSTHTAPAVRRKMAMTQSTEAKVSSPHTPPVPSTNSARKTNALSPSAAKSPEVYAQLPSWHSQTHPSHLMSLIPHSALSVILGSGNWHSAGIQLNDWNDVWRESSREEWVLKLHLNQHHRVAIKTQCLSHYPHLKTLGLDKHIHGLSVSARTALVTLFNPAQHFFAFRLNPQDKHGV